MKQNHLLYFYYINLIAYYKIKFWLYKLVIDLVEGFNKGVNNMG